MCLGCAVSVITIASVKKPSAQSGNEIRMIRGNVVFLSVVVREMIQLETVRASQTTQA